ncbi:hypothetical protein [Actinoplanes sp. DH11]|uniref:hypothetical protein n=1 Tax=Actinoplanes sp. DH11 TaxID=2857011 RepID=UPI001E53E687|nr:hypothetical protein [Actinoplanes sp. DH11]
MFTGPGARRHDQGARTLFELTPMAVAALEQILARGPPRIAATLATITGDIAARLAAAGVGLTEPRGPHLHITAYDVDRLVTTLIAAV